MPRIINTASPGKLRHQARRTIAEMLRRLMQKGQIDNEGKDMVAAIVFALRDIDATVQTTTEAWEKRNYYVKADQFRFEWEWTGAADERLSTALLDEDWQALALALADLAPRFEDIQVKRLTRKTSSWKGAYQLLLREEA